MFRLILSVVITVLILISLYFWWSNTLPAPLGWYEFSTIGIIFILVGFVIFFTIRRVLSLVRHEPAEDEYSKQLMTRASSCAYYISIYLWLAVMYFSDRVQLENHTLIGLGIAGMALVFFFSWIGIKLIGMRNA